MLSLAIVWTSDHICWRLVRRFCSIFAAPRVVVSCSMEESWSATPSRVLGCFAAGVVFGVSTQRISSTIGGW